MQNQRMLDKRKKEIIIKANAEAKLAKMFSLISKKNFELNQFEPEYLSFGLNEISKYERHLTTVKNIYYVQSYG